MARNTGREAVLRHRLFLSRFRVHGALCRLGELLTSKIGDERNKRARPLMLAI